MADPKDEYSPVQATTNLLDIGKRFLVGGVPGAVNARLQQTNPPAVVTGVMQNAAGKIAQAAGKIAQGGRNAAAVGPAFITGGVPGAFSVAAHRMGGKSLVSEANAAAPEYANPNPNGGGGMIRPQTPAVPKAQGVSAPVAPTPQFVQTQWNKPAPAARPAKPRQTISAMAARTTTAAQTPAAPAQAAPAADYYDGLQAYINRVAASDPGMQELQRTNRDANEIAVYRSALGKGFDGSPEQQRMLALGAQAGARNNPNDPTSWDPVVVNDQVNRYDAKTGGMSSEEDMADRDARDSLMNKKVGDPLTQREASIISQHAAALTLAERRDQADVERTMIGDAGQTTREAMGNRTSERNANLAHGESNKAKALENAATARYMKAVESGDPAAIEKAKQGLTPFRSGTPTVSDIAMRKTYNEFGDPVGEVPYDRRGGMEQFAPETEKPKRKISKADIAATAEAHGISEAEVVRRLKAAGKM